MTAGLALARAAEGLAGCRFRLHGRDPATGLDCIGVLAAALVRIGRPASLPTGYSLRTGRYAGLETEADAHGMVRATGPAQAGDVFVLRPGPGQLHLAISASQPDRMVEAHAGLRRVVISRGPATCSIVQHWRLGAGQEG